METKELMLNDLVYAIIDGQKKIIKVRSIEFAKIKYQEGAKIYDCHRFEPIPLTAEILEKNGILLHNSSSYFKEYMWTTGRIDEYADIYIEVWKDQQDNWRWDNLRFRLHFCGGEVSLMKMHYVHELQHALRLCKIEKEIEL